MGVDFDLRNIGCRPNCTHGQMDPLYGCDAPEGATHQKNYDVSNLNHRYENEFEAVTNCHHLTEAF